MIWFFDRNGQQLRYEIRRSENGEAYELVVTYPGGRVEVEQLRDPSALLKRCTDLAELLKIDGWENSLS
jgi:hypothetical protein